MDDNLLLTPGPTKLSKEVCEALGRAIIHHRTPQFQAYLKEAVEGLQYVFQTKNDVFILASSGTGAMEASVCNLLSPGDKVITIEGGKFGERWSELCKAYGVETQTIQVSWGKAVEPGEIDQLLKEEPETKAVFVTLCETSTGAKADIATIAQVVQKTQAVLVVDAISGLTADDLKTDEWGVDVVCCGSQKGLMLPPGLGFICVGPKAWDLVNQSTNPKYYFDLKKAKKAGDKNDTPFTPAINLIIALTESLKSIKQRGLEDNLAFFAKLAEATRKAVAALGLKLFTDQNYLSNAVTAVKVPEGVDGVKLVKTMRDTYGITMAGGQAEAKGKIFRIAQMGCLTGEDIIKGIGCLETVLKELGYQFEEGSGVKAAQNVLNA